MSEFLEQVFAAQANQASPRRARRKLGQGFTGGRYAALLILLAGLTAAPTWIMLRAGAEGLEQPAVSSIQPLLIDPVPSAAPPPGHERPAIALPAQESPVRQPPQPTTATTTPPRHVLERQSYVDTGARPVQKKRPTKPKAPAPQQQQQQPQQQPQATPTNAATSPAPALTSPPQVRPTRTRIAERPKVIPPEPPQLNDLRARS